MIFFWHPSSEVWKVEGRKEEGETMVERLRRIVMFSIFEFRSAESEKRKEEGGKAIESSFAHFSF